MADYNEQTVTGKAWQRCYAINIANQSGSTPSITFLEERVALIDGKINRTAVLSLSLNFDPTAEFDLYDPTTLQPTGQKATHAQVYGLLFSAYMSTALARDAAQQPTPQPE